MEGTYELARTLGGVGAEDEARLRTLCDAAEAELLRRLKPEVEAADCAEAFQLAAAWTALADLCVGECADGVSSFSAGSLTIKTGDALTALERSAGLRRRAEAVLSPYLKDGGFAFRGVRG